MEKKEGMKGRKERKKERKVEKKERMEGRKERKNER